MVEADPYAGPVGNMFVPNVLWIIGGLVVIIILIIIYFGAGPLKSLSEIGKDKLYRPKKRYISFCHSCGLEIAREISEAEIIICPHCSAEISWRNL